MGERRTARIQTFRDSPMGLPAAEESQKLSDREQPGKCLCRPFRACRREIVALQPRAALVTLAGPGLCNLAPSELRAERSPNFHSVVTSSQTHHSDSCMSVREARALPASGQSRCSVMPGEHFQPPQGAESDSLGREPVVDGATAASSPRRGRYRLRPQVPGRRPFRLQPFMSPPAGAKGYSPLSLPTASRPWLLDSAPCGGYECRSVGNHVAIPGSGNSRSQGHRDRTAAEAHHYPIPRSPSASR